MTADTETIREALEALQRPRRERDWDDSRAGRAALAALGRVEERERELTEALRKAADTFGDFSLAFVALGKPIMREASEIAERGVRAALAGSVVGEKREPPIQDGHLVRAHSSPLPAEAGGGPLGGVWVPITVPCGCRIFFGPTLDNGITQPLRETCSHGRFWSGSFLPKTREAIIGEIVSVWRNEVTYAVEPAGFAEMYRDKFPASAGSTERKAG